MRTPELLVAGGARPVTKAVLFPVRFLYSLATGCLGTNDDAADWFATRYPHAELVLAARAWRTEGLPEFVAAHALLARHLLPVYSIFVAEYVQALHELGDDQLAERLASRRP